MMLILLSRLAFVNEHKILFEGLNKLFLQISASLFKGLGAILLEGGNLSLEYFNLSFGIITIMYMIFERHLSS